MSWSHMQKTRWGTGRLRRRSPEHPVRYHNVAADPRVELQDGPIRQDMLAREVTGEEKAVWWARAVEAFPPYAEYQRNTAERFRSSFWSRRPRCTDPAQTGSAFRSPRLSRAAQYWPTATPRLGNTPHIAWPADWRSALIATADLA